MKYAIITTEPRPESTAKGGWTMDIGFDSISGDPQDVLDQAIALVRSLVRKGVGVSLYRVDPETDTWCGKCRDATPDHEPRRNQPTRVERGYYACAVCGYVKEGRVPDAAVHG